MKIQIQERPNVTTLAVRLLYGALALGLLNLALRGLYVPPGTSATFQYAGVAVVLVLVASFIYLIGTGRNWARLTFALLALLSLGSVLSGSGGFGPWLAGDSVAATLALVQGLLCLAGLVLLFLPASHRWFRSASQVRRHAGESRRLLGWLLASVSAVSVLAFVVGFAVTGEFSVLALILAAVFGAPAADLLVRRAA